MNIFQRIFRSRDKPENRTPGSAWITKDMLMADKLFWLPYIAAGRIVVKNPGSGSSGVYYFRTPWSYYKIGLNVGSYGNYIRVKQDKTSLVCAICIIWKISFKVR